MDAVRYASLHLDGRCPARCLGLACGGGGGASPEVWTSHDRPATGARGLADDDHWCPPSDPDSLPCAMAALMNWTQTTFHLRPGNLVPGSHTRSHICSAMARLPNALVLARDEQRAAPHAHASIQTRLLMYMSAATPCCGLSTAHGACSKERGDDAKAIHQAQCPCCHPFIHDRSKPVAPDYDGIVHRPSRPLEVSVCRRVWLRKRREEAAVVSFTDL